MRYYCIYVIIFFFFTSCRKEKLYTDVKLLKQYIQLSKTPEDVRFNINEKQLRSGSQDCSKIVNLVGILKFSEKDFNFIVNNLEKKKKYDIELSTKGDFYKEWYPERIKNLFTREESDLNKQVITPIYYGDFFNKKNEDNILCIITNNNEIIIKAGFCN